MKPIAVFALLALVLALPAWAETPAQPPAPEALAREIDDLAVQVKNAREQIDDLQQRVETIEKRLGESFRPVSPFDTVERRLDDLEKDVDRLRR